MEKLIVSAKPSGKKAFTLIETAVAIVILTIVLSSIVGVFSKGFSLLRMSQEKTAALGLAQGIMEEFSDWDTITSWGDCADDTDVGNFSYSEYASDPGDPVSLNGVNYICALTIADVPVGINNNVFKKVKVDVSWTSKGKTRTVTMLTLKTEY